MISDHMTRPRILLIVTGGIAAYKSLELVRLLKKRGMAVRAVMTRAAHQFVTPLALGALTEDHVYTDLFDLKDEREMGHIQLSRQADLVVVCPASADMLARMAAGMADDLAATLLLATDKPVLAVPAMNVRMWLHPATQRNLATLKADGIRIMEPDEGDMACGEFGPGRLPEPEAIAARVEAELKKPSPGLGRGLGEGTERSAASVEQPSATAAPLPTPLPGGERELSAQPDFAPETHRPLYGKHILITAGPTHEPIDPVRYIANRSSGKQGFAIAAAAADMGATVTLIAGPVTLPTPPGVIRVDVESAREMAAAVEDALPADVAIMVAAVADWRAAEMAETKIKKDGSGAVPPLALAENPDILASLAHSPRRPGLLVGFAAETNDVIAHAQAKLARKGCDWIIANDVSADPMGGELNRVHIVTAAGVDSWDRLPKDAVAKQIMRKIADALS
jgi:phosphopantothenoylcysteine decarboxylase/phosphopantothenate--cysteine ligase